jgi:hypothetical protein
MATFPEIVSPEFIYTFIVPSIQVTLMHQPTRLGKNQKNSATQKITFRQFIVILLRYKLYGTKYTAVDYT